MSDQDELPQWSAAAGQSAAQYVQPPERSRGRGILFGLLGLVALLGTAALGYFIAQSQGESTTTGTDPAAPTADDGETAISDAGSEEDAGDAEDDPGQTADGQADSDALTVDVQESERSEAEADAGAVEPDDASPTVQSERTAVIQGGILYLRGPIPSQEIVDAIVAKAAAVVGEENVVVEYEIDPTTDFDPSESTPLYVEDVVLFPFNSSTIDPQFYPILDLGVILLSQNPQASITVVTRTDAVGSEETNLEVATERADAVIDYWLGQGVDPDQIIADPRGEEGAEEDAAEEQAARERRAEFIITGVLE